jgi:benzoylsuccinyl-CoA thiolase BbsB subunit
MYYESLGLCEPGAAVALLESGKTSLGGSQVVNPSGGLLCRGHPVGATGIAQICEAVWQLRGQAQDRQVQGARVALTHCTGGGVAGLDHGSCAINILVAA